MSKNSENKLVPKLRFPEFTKSKEWDAKEFSEYIVLYRGSSPRPIQNYFTKDENGVNWIKIGDTQNSTNYVIAKADEKITIEGATKSRKVSIGELILANSMSFGKTYLLEIEGCIYDGWFVLREYEQHFDKQFLLQLLNSEHLQKQYKRLSAGGIVQNISSDIVYKTILSHTSFSEQQKIAACLSSLDEVISAENQKLEVLKDHKKGLLQNLFPQEGETVPKFRFKEFEDSGEWVERKLGDICDLITKGTTPRSFSENGIRFIKIEAFKENYIDSSKCVFIDEGIHLKELKRSILKEHDILFAIAGATIGKVNIVTSELLPANTNQALAIIRLKKEEKTAFVLNILKSEMMQKYIKKSISVGAQPNLNLEQMGDFSFPYPPSKNEQQKIASTLSSIDDLINAQYQKLEALQLHKKGLLQGLFPNTLTN